MFKQYIKANGPRVNNIKCELYYSLGGMNYFTYEREARGYYLSVSPVERSGNMESYTAFSGNKVCLLEVARRSKSAEEKAKALINKYLKSLVEHVCVKNQIILEEEI